MEKNLSLKIYGVLGYPAKHSLSPLMHNAAFKALGINAEYKIFEKKPEELESFLKSLSRDDICGLNVTVPYKEKVIPFLNKISSESGLIKAVNTIKASSVGLEGFNTDGEGFIRSLSADLGFNPAGKVIAVIGAGGAARAILVYLSQKRPKEMRVYDIDKPKAQALLEDLKKNFNFIDFQAAGSIDELGINTADLLVNASPVGMKESDPCLINEKQIRRGLFVYDLIYNPAETKLLKLARENGAQVSNGIGMLLYQGALSFKVWTGQDAPVQIMRGALMEGIKK